MYQQSLEMQREQSQAQMEPLTTLGAAQVAKTTYNARDFETKAFSKMKGFKGDESLAGLAVQGIELRGVSVKQLRPWIGLRSDTISRFLTWRSIYALMLGGSTVSTYCKG